MRLENIIAVPHPDGNRIDLKWENPDPVNYPGVRVMRREGTHPTSHNDGVIVAEGIGLTHAKDINLKGETVYYYALFPYKGNPPEYQIDLHNRASAMATAPYNMAGQMMELLPAIYHRYDQEKGQLRRFLDMPGGQLDQLYSVAKAMLNLHNLDKVDGRLLPLLAQWIGWRTDYNLEIEKQRNEIRNAPDIFKTIGIIPNAEATVKRLINWECRTKEFVHNVFLSNRPERLNIYLRQRGSDSKWSEPKEPLSLDFAYEGRPAIVRDTDGTIYLFYHTLKKGQWNIWYKTYQEDKGWAPSQPLTDRAGIDKYPAAVIRGATLWVFWSVFDETEQKWRIDFCTCTGGIWSFIDVFKSPAETEPLPERKQPCAVADNTDGLWLFWLERVGVRWQMKYNRHDGTAWGSAVTFPLDGTDDPRVEADTFVLMHPTDATKPLWVFWARQEPVAEPGQTRWTIGYRTKGNTNLDDTGWSNIEPFSATPLGYHDREPAAIVNGNNIELFWSSNRDGSWSIWRNILNITTSNWEDPEKVADSLYSQRDPLPLLVSGQTLLTYRSNESLSYDSKVYGATETVDFRYAGCITVDTGNARKNSLHGRFEDFQTYTYDTGKNGQRTDEDWYARDTVGVYLTPNTESKELIARNHKVVKSVLRQFLPIQVQPVFIIEPVLYKEMIYTYDYPDAEPQHLIHEQMVDTILGEVYRGLSDEYLDRAGFRWLRTWQEDHPYGIMPDLSVTPPDLSHRLFLKGVEEGE